MDAHTRAMNRAKEIMTKNTDALIPADVDEKIRTKVPGLVTGKLGPIL
jgi:hypothetical protein